MCGIAGAWQPSGGAAADGLPAALAALAHRGPDDQGSHLDPPAVLGVRRLAILDLTAGAQPLTNEDGSVVVVCNGEIYNHRALRRRLEASGHRFRSRSDVEVIPHLYEELGDALWSELHGMFAVALWDARRRRLLLGRDRLGKKPLYLADTAGGGLVFASELDALRPLAAAAGRTLSVDPQGLYDYLSLGVVPQPTTIWREARALPPAGWLTRGPDGAAEGRYWRLDETPRDGVSAARAAEEVRAGVAEAVAARLESDVPLGVFLSGGVDSTVVAYEAARAAGSALRTFTVAVADRRLDESAVAAATAERLGAEHRTLHLEVAPLAELERAVAVYGQPFADPSALPSLAVSRLAAEHVKVVLNGDGGDELFAGYRRAVGARLVDLAPPLPAAAWRAAGRTFAPLGGRRRSAGGFAARLARGAALPPGGRYLAWTTDLLGEDDKRRLWRGGPQRPTEEWVAAQLPAGATALRTQLAGDRRINLLSDLLVKMDMATMAASVEARSPLLDHRLAELAGRLPDRLLVRRLVPKAVLRAAYRGLVPDAVLDAPKRGFEVPLADWLAGPLSPVVGDLLAAPGARVADLLDGAWLRRLVAGDPAAARGNRSALVYALLVLELWLRRQPAAGGAR